MVLLIMSCLFYYFAATPYTILFLLFSALVAYASTHIMNMGQIRTHPHIRGCVLFVSILLNVIPWLLTSANDLWIKGSAILHRYVGIIPELHALPLVAAMGMAYYTSQIISYLVDCYWDNAKPQNNPIKLFAFICFFPQLTTGPISRYENLRLMYNKHYFQYKNLCFGCQRIIWGLFKKLVIADRVGIIVNSILADPVGYSGIFHWIMVLVYPIQLYADFSGCMDIALGSAELFDIHLAENFNNPFFSKSIREFWTRWHITLGVWAKEYVMYPILKTKIMVNFSKSTKKKLGKHMAKFIPAAFAAGMVWLVMGVWHGGIKYIVGVSLYYWVLIEMGELFEPISKKIIYALKINTSNFSWRFFQRARTYLIYAIGATFFNTAGIHDALYMIKSCFTLPFDGNMNPWILCDGSILKTGITYAQINIIIIGVVLMVIVANLRESYGYAREWVSKQGIIFRWLIWILLLFAVLIFGAYGPGYDASKFIYGQF